MYHLHNLALVPKYHLWYHTHNLKPMAICHMLMQKKNKKEKKTLLYGSTTNTKKRIQCNTKNLNLTTSNYII